MGHDLATRGRGAHPIHGEQRYTRMDRVRADELNRRLSLGETPRQAWAEIVTDPNIGLRRWRGRSDIPAGVVQVTLERFLARAVDDETRAALNLGRVNAARQVTAALERTRRIMEGDFGIGRVKLRGRGEDAEEEVEIDASAANVQLRAARTFLEIVRVLPKSGSRTTVNNATQVNVSAEHEAAVRRARQVIEAEEARTEAEEMAEDHAQRYDEWMAEQIRARGGEEAE